jgi:diadenosine tetraphosphate (Ap4A) HIT family hydrolase
MSDSPFVDPAPERIFYQWELVIGIWDGFPVSPGHALIVPRRLVATWFEATRAEQIAILDGIEAAKRAIEEGTTPQGYNIGINVGAAAGQTIFHLHVHVVPRYDGDVRDGPGRAELARSGLRGNKTFSQITASAPAFADLTTPLVTSSSRPFC